MAASRAKSSGRKASGGKSRARGGTSAKRSTTRRRTSAAATRSAGQTSRRGGATQSTEGQITTDHEEIRRWVEERGGRPACVRGTGGPNDIGLLRIDMPGYTGEESLQEVSWDQFFEKFDERGLAFLHQDKTKGGQRSNFNKLIDRNEAESSGASRGSNRRR